MNLRNLDVQPNNREKRLLSDNMLEEIKEDPASLEESVSILGKKNRGIINKLASKKTFQYEEEEKEDGSVFIKTDLD